MNTPYNRRIIYRVAQSIMQQSACIAVGNNINAAILPLHELFLSAAEDSRSRSIEAWIKSPNWRTIKSNRIKISFGRVGKAKRKVNEIKDPCFKLLKRDGKALVFPMPNGRTKTPQPIIRQPFKAVLQPNLTLLSIENALPLMMC